MNASNAFNASNGCEMLRGSLVPTQRCSARLSYWQLWPVRPHPQDSGTSQNVAAMRRFGMLWTGPIVSTSEKFNKFEVH